MGRLDVEAGHSQRAVESAPQRVTVLVANPEVAGPAATEASHPLHQQRTPEDACVRCSLASHHGAPLAKSRPVQCGPLLNARSGGEPFGRRRLCQAGETDYGF